MTPQEEAIQRVLMQGSMNPASRIPAIPEPQAMMSQGQAPTGADLQGDVDMRLLEQLFQQSRRSPGDYDPADLSQITSPRMMTRAPGGLMTGTAPTPDDAHNFQDWGGPKQGMGRLPRPGPKLSPQEYAQHLKDAWGIEAPPIGPNGSMPDIMSMNPREDTMAETPRALARVRGGPEMEPSPPSFQAPRAPSVRPVMQLQQAMGNPLAATNPGRIRARR